MKNNVSMLIVVLESFRKSNIGLIKSISIIMAMVMAVMKEQIKPIIGRKEKDT